MNLKGDGKFKEFVEKIKEAEDVVDSVSVPPKVVASVTFLGTASYLVNAKEKIIQVKLELICNFFLVMQRKFSALMS